MSYPRIVDGETISFSRGCTFLAIVYMLLGLLLAFFGAGLFGFATTGEGPTSVSVALTGLGFVVPGISVVAGIMFIALGWDYYTDCPFLVLGREYMQWVARKQVRWQVPYAQITKIDTLFRPFDWLPCVGIQLATPDDPDKLWPKRARRRRRGGYDFVLPTMHCAEPAVRVVEAALTCMHRYRAESSVS